MATFTDKLEELCAQRGVSVDKACREAGVAPTSISNIRAGITKNPSVKTVSRLSEYFDVPVAELMETKKPPGAVADGMDAEDVEILRIIHSLQPEKRAAAVAMLRGLADT